MLTRFNKQNIDVLQEDETLNLKFFLQKDGNTDFIPYHITITNDKGNFTAEYLLQGRKYSKKGDSWEIFNWISDLWDNPDDIFVTEYGTPIVDENYAREVWVDENLSKRNKVVNNVKIKLNSIRRRLNSRINLSSKEDTMELLNQCRESGGWLKIKANNQIMSIYYDDESEEFVISEKEDDGDDDFFPFLFTSDEQEVIAELGDKVEVLDDENLSKRKKSNLSKRNKVMNTKIKLNSIRRRRLKS